MFKMDAVTKAPQHHQQFHMSRKCHMSKNVTKTTKSHGY